MVLLLAAAALAPAQEPPAVFRADLSLVAVDAQVLEGSTVVTGLHKDDLLVRENGKQQPILYFGVEEVPLELLVLIDKSGSMRPVVEAVAAGAHEALAQLRPPDRVGIMIFDRRARLAAPLTADMEAIETRLKGFVRTENFGGGTNINGAVYAAATYMRQQPRTGARRSILILTDNWSPKMKKDRTVVRELWEADTVLNALIFNSALKTVLQNYQRVAAPWTYLLDANVKKIVDQTGGESLNARSAAAAFRDMLERIRKRYSLYYREPPGPPGKPRSIRVELSEAARKSHPRAAVRARRGYIPAGTLK